MLMAFLQLADVRRQLEAELQHLTASYGQLKAAQHRFRTCIEAVDSIDPSNEDRETLVPLTSSLYVPGKLSDLNKVIVDVGTGYYVEKSTEDAKQMYREKVEFVGKKLDQLQETILRKEDNMRVVRDVSMVVRRPFPVRAASNRCADKAERPYRKWPSNSNNSNNNKRLEIYLCLYTSPFEKFRRPFYAACPRPGIARTLAEGFALLLCIKARISTSGEKRK